MYSLFVYSFLFLGILKEGFLTAPLTTTPVHCTNSNESSSCPNGCYGPYCDIPCKNCDTDENNSCNRSTGICHQCQWSKYGTYCDKDCPPGCQEYEPCFRENGTCYQCKSDGPYSDSPPGVGYCNGSEFSTHAEDPESEDPTIQNTIPTSNQDVKGGSESEQDIPQASVYYAIAPVVGLFILITTVLVLCRKKSSRPKTEKVSLRRNEDKDHVVDDKNGHTKRRTDIERGPNSVYNMRGSVALLTEIDHEKPVEVIPEPKPVSSDYFNVRFFKIPVKELEEKAGRMKSEDKIVTEFADLPTGLLEMYDESTRKENMKRNRYKGIYPYNHSRVKLNEEDYDGVTYPSYINACFVHGFKKENAYIAAQGPFTPDTVIDFWRMTWQLSVKQIVMLTNIIEGSTIKCLRYWPENEDDYGPLHVMTEHEEIYQSYAVRIFQLQKGEEKRSVMQFHFTAWPDKGVPDDVTSVLEFRQEVVNHCNYNEDGPMIVHCSAGIGRTGTFIALDSLLREGSSRANIDVINCVSKMRQQRVCVIQTLEQYVFLYDSLVEGLRNVEIVDIPENQEVNHTSVNVSESLKSKAKKPLPAEPEDSGEEHLDKGNNETVIEMNGIHPSKHEGVNVSQDTKL